MSTKFIGRVDVNNTPFSIIEFEDGKFNIALGNELISKKKFNSKKAAIQYINSKPWELIINVACLAVEVLTNNQEKEANNA